MASDPIPSPSAPAISPMGISCRSIAIILFYGITLLLIALGSGRVLTRHEVLAAQPAREMLHDGHWIIPTFAGVPRLVKPPTTGWMIAACMAIFGESEWAARLPAVIAGIITALIIACMAGRWFGDRVACVAGLIQLTCFYVLMQARLAEADMPLCAAVCLAMAMFALARVDSPAGRVKCRWVAWVFFAALGASVLIKGVGPVFILPSCAIYLLWNRDWKGFGFFFSPIGWLIFLAIVLPWPILAYRAYPGILEIWEREMFGRAKGDMGGAEPFYFYLWNVPMLLLPWTPLALVGAAVGLRNGIHRSPIGRFLSSWFFAGLFIMSVVAWKHKHYVIPILPPMSIVMAGGMLVWIAAAHRQLRPRRALAAGLIVAACAIAAAIVFWRVKVAAPEMAGLIALVAAGSVATLYAEHRRNRLGQLSAVFATAWTVVVGVQIFVMPKFDGYRPSRDLAIRANAAVPSGQTIYLVNLGEDHIAYYLRFPMARIEEEPDVKKLAEGENEAFLITSAGVVDRLRASREIVILDKSEEKLRKDESEADRTVFARIMPRSSHL